MIPTKRLVVLAFVAFVVAIAVGVMGASRLAMYVLDGTLASAVLLDAALVRKRRVVMERSVGAILSVGRANVVTLSLRNTSRRTIRGTVADDPVGAVRAAPVGHGHDSLRRGADPAWTARLRLRPRPLRVAAQPARATGEDRN